MWLSQEWVWMDAWALDAPTLTSQEEEEAQPGWWRKAAHSGPLGFRGNTVREMCLRRMEWQLPDVAESLSQMKTKSPPLGLTRWCHGCDSGGTAGANTRLEHLKERTGVRKGKWGTETTPYSFKESCCYLRTHICSCSWNISWTTWNRAVDHTAWKCILETPD